VIVLLLLSLSAGFYGLVTGDVSLFAPIAIALHFWLIVAWVFSCRRHRDFLNPLSLILIIGFLRFSVPGLILLSGGGRDVAFFDALRLTDEDWMRGSLLACCGLLSFAAGWLAAPVARGTENRLKVRLSPAVLKPAAAVMGAGLLCLFIFVSSNASLGEVVVEGSFRGTEVQPGTGKFFYLGLLTIAGSVVLSAGLLQTYKKAWRALWPVALCMLAYIILGGRGRAATPLLIGLAMVLYVVGRPQGFWRMIFTAGGLILGFTWMAYMVALYRGGWGMNALGESLSLQGLWKYIEFSLMSDVGHLHSMAAATIVGPGELGGRTFYGLLGPMNKILLLPEKSTGVYIVQVLCGFGPRRWGLHASLIGDAYVNFGAPGVALVLGFCGFILQRVYTAFRTGVFHAAFYAVTLVYSLRIFFESIEKWGEYCIVLFAAVCLVKLGEALQRYAVLREVPA